MSASIEEIYHGYSDEELRDERVRLKKQYDHAYSSQNTGSKGYEKDMAHLTARMQSLTRVMRERGLSVVGGGVTPRGGAEFKGQVDLSGPGLDEF